MVQYIAVTSHFSEVGSSDVDGKAFVGGVLILMLGMKAALVVWGEIGSVSQTNESKQAYRSHTEPQNLMAHPG